MPEKIEALDIVERRDPSSSEVVVRGFVNGFEVEVTVSVRSMRMGSSAYDALDVARGLANQTAGMVIPYGR